MIPGIICKALMLLFGVMYPAYASYKTVKNKHVKNYVKWMMYWIVYAAFMCLESLTDIFLEFWFPFYYEIKLLVLLWLICPFTKGSTIVYKEIVHPTLMKKETDIDEFLIKCKSQTYNAVAQTAKQTFQMTAAIVIQHTSAVSGLLPQILLQQVANSMDIDSNTPSVKTKKQNSPVIESTDFVSTNEWSILKDQHVEKVDEQPAVRPKRRKALNLKKTPNININGVGTKRVSL
ncbi:receptor expression-enhancing protein 1-like [Daktulosphaira vitifoliae]|uniref:receptor expression-enhancing protein 1-like n=1 Tax=Daktulosphaira vitifoliae TaxID=58002 RepID=UPI0021AAB5B0|nr:receptor expression-enhancing protein 1-like [Daktulosphaira vitifoliae]XP_050529002.1 receptor expression-enhancing protein 1-like [Daktulosphaira vitifoliae]